MDRRNALQTDNSHLFLDDEIINGYLSLITGRSMNTVYAFETFFFVNLTTKGFDGVKRWTRKIDLFSKHKVFIPMNFKNVHWALICIDFKLKEIQYYDSLRVKNSNCLKIVFNYLMLEHIDKRGKKLDTNQWSLRTMMNIPQQQNNYDCGVFVCMYAEHLSRDAVLSFGQRNMGSFRKIMEWELKINRLVDIDHDEHEVELYIRSLIPNELVH